MRFDEYRKHDATALAGLIAKREISAGDVLEIAIARAEQVNPAINAIVHKQYEKARKAAAAGRTARAAGRACPTSSRISPSSRRASRQGSAAACSRTSWPITTAPTSRAARRPASSSFGRTSTPEFGLNPNTEPRLNGPCRNPWNLEHSAGGSSGGAAAAVSRRHPARWRTRPTAAARSASPPRNAVCSD